MDRLTLYGSFTSSSSYKPMLYLALARLPFSSRRARRNDQADPSAFRAAIDVPHQASSHLPP
jgi:glutathione S-transferase